jgi:hypothetical protein
VTIHPPRTDCLTCSARLKRTGHSNCRRSGQSNCRWSQEEIDILRGALSGLAGTIFLEFDVPRLGSRIDAVLVSGSPIFAIEFK